MLSWMSDAPTSFPAAKSNNGKVDSVFQTAILRPHFKSRCFSGPQHRSGTFSGPFTSIPPGISTPIACGPCTWPSSPSNQTLFDHSTSHSSVGTTQHGHHNCKQPQCKTFSMLPTPVRRSAHSTPPISRTGDSACFTTLSNAAASVSSDLTTEISLFRTSVNKLAVVLTDHTNEENQIFSSMSNYMSNMGTVVI